MSPIFESNHEVRMEPSGARCRVKQYLGAGGQGEVYEADIDRQPVALKWYFPYYLSQDERLRERLILAVRQGPPTPKFLWPIGLASAEKMPGFGYVMPLREKRFRGIVDMMKRRVDPTFRAVCTACFEVADSYYQLHSKGMCYRDISFGNVFIDPGTGEVRICDNDNVDVNGQPGAIAGTARFMAPEIVRGEAYPSTETDLYSLSILLFCMLMVHHPLEGKKESAIRCMDLPAMTKIYGVEPVFIFDPKDESNKPVQGYHDNALVFWPIYPKFVQYLFTRAFTDGIRDPQNGRVREVEWRGAMVRLKDSVIYCQNCGSQNFYDVDVLKTPDAKTNRCWSCKKQVELPPRMKIGNEIVMLAHDTELFPHHTGDLLYDFSKPSAKVVQHPQDPRIWGLKNLGGEKWVTTTSEGKMSDVEPGKSATIANGTKVNFGKREGQIRS